MSEILEHDVEAAPGLPGRLPDDERVLWQGRPSVGRLILSAFHVRKLAFYFSALLAARFVLQWQGGAGLGESVAGITGLGLLAAVTLGMLALYAWLTARATLYTITDRRVVIRCGVALQLSANLPFHIIDSAGLRTYRDSTGDIALVPARGHRASYMLLWPHVSMRRLLRVRPMFRALTDAEQVAAVLAGALERHAAAAEPATSPAALSSDHARAPAPARGRRQWNAYPTVPLAGAVALVLVSIVSVAILRLGDGSGPGHAPQVTASLELRFEDAADGSVTVYDAASGKVIHTVAPGEDGFLRATLRSLATARQKVGAGPDAPFALVQTAERRLLLIDPVTNREIDLWAFGRTNARAFAQFFDLAPAREATLRTGPDARDGDVAALALSSQEK